VAYGMTIIRNIVMLLALSLWATVTLAASRQTDASAAEKQFQAWLAAFNEGDRAVLQEFLRKNSPDRADDVDGLLRFREMTGGFEFKKTEKSVSTRYVALLKEKDSDTFVRATVEVEEAEPYKIKSLQVLMTATPAEFRVAPMTEHDAIAALKKLSEETTASDKFSGAVAISKNGKTVFEQAYGLADREKKTPNTLQTRFRMGSMNKMFTATAILQLAQAGKLKLTDPLGKYLANYPNKDVATKVTIHQLLTHTGGTGDIFGPEFDERRLELKTLQDYVQLYGQRGLQFEPGSKWDYSNYGFLLLGVIVEKASGQDYYEYVQEHIFKTAGMTLSGSLPEDQAVQGRSVGYMKPEGSGNWESNTATLPYRGTSAGGGYTTVEDLLKFANALSTYKLLDKKHTELLTTGHVDTPMGLKYAYGFMDSPAEGPRWFGHSGGSPGMNGDLRIFPQSGYVVAVLSNQDPPAAESIATYVSNRLPEK
jgi:D-alanyl-D-alanine carboxypeptidase